MGLGIRLIMRQELTVKQKLEQVMLQKLVIIQTQRPLLRIYLKREHIFRGLYRQCVEEGRERHYCRHGMDFRYAEIRKDEIPAWVTESCGSAFSHCMYDPFEAMIAGKKFALAKGEWLLFVVTDFVENTPQEFLKYFAVHERGEQVTLGEHNLASKLEFGVARKEGNLKRYMRWIEENCPRKFADIFSFQIHTEIPDIEEYRKYVEKMSSSAEAEVVKELIETFEWSQELLTRLLAIRKVNDEIRTGLIKTLDHLGTFSRGYSGKIAPLYNLIERELGRSLSSIKESGMERYLNYAYLNPAWKEFFTKMENDFIQMLSKRSSDQESLSEILTLEVSRGFPNKGVFSRKLEEAIIASA